MTGISSCGAAFLVFKFLISFAITSLSTGTKENSVGFMKYCFIELAISFHQNFLEVALIKRSITVIMLKTPIIESYPRTKLSQSKQLNRSKVTSHFLEEFKRKSEDDFGNSIGDENTRSNEMKSRFQREQRTRIVFQTQKRTAKVQNFQEDSLVFQLRTVGKYGAS